jgi:hypothetical protein
MAWSTESSPMNTFLAEMTSNVSKLALGGDMCVVAPESMIQSLPKLNASPSEAMKA